MKGFPKGKGRGKKAAKPGKGPHIKKDVSPRNKKNLKK